MTVVMTMVMVGLMDYNVGVDIVRNPVLLSTFPVLAWERGISFWMMMKDWIAAERYTDL